MVPMENIGTIGKRDNHHSTYHIHLAKEIILKKVLGSETYAEETDKYSNYYDALSFFEIL